MFTKEIPNELSLGFVITGCNVHCPDCHSKHIWDVNSENKGICLTEDEIDRLIKLIFAINLE